LAFVLSFPLASFGLGLSTIGSVAGFLFCVRSLVLAPERSVLTWSSLVISLPLVLIQVLIFALPVGALRSLGFLLNFDLSGLASF
jgi:hypothetical protein